MCYFVLLYTGKNNIKYVDKLKSSSKNILQFII